MIMQSVLIFITLNSPCTYCVHWRPDEEGPAGYDVLDWPILDWLILLWPMVERCEPLWGLAMTL
jgi:hypothetical protein